MKGEGKMQNCNEQIEMVIECTDEYSMEDLPDGRCKITMLIPKGFTMLWACKLGEWRTTMEEIEYYRKLEEDDKG